MMRWLVLVPVLALTPRTTPSLAGDWDVYIALSAQPKFGFEGWRRMGFAHFAGSDSGNVGLPAPPHRRADAHRHPGHGQWRLGAADAGRPGDDARGLARRHAGGAAVHRRPAAGPPLPPRPPGDAGSGRARLPGVDDAGLRLAVRGHRGHAGIHAHARRRAAGDLRRAAGGAGAVRRRAAAHALPAGPPRRRDGGGRRAATSSWRSTCAAATSPAATSRTSATTPPTSRTATTRSSGRRGCPAPTARSG